MKIIDKAAKYRSRVAIISNGQTYTYEDLLCTSERIAGNLLANRPNLNGARITFLIPPSFEYTAVQWGIWRAGGVAVPLCALHPLPSMKYVVEDSLSEIVIAHGKYEDFVRPLTQDTTVVLVSLQSLLSDTEVVLPKISPDNKAMILYTSGTTSKPKGVVTTHKHIEAQITTLVKAWEWEKKDHILNVLPLHHVHGIINVMSCALWVGACCEFLPKFDPEQVWKSFTEGKINLFMGVPTMYHQLISYWDACPRRTQEKMSEVAAKFRLMVSGSAALPVPVLEKWQHITGHTLLERYGMTEIGMGLSNSYRGERRPGHVGLPIEGVSLRLVDDQLRDVPEGTPGEIIIKGPSVFNEYWNKPEATKKAFTEDGWFLTGDTAIFNKGSYKILGRNSVDIIKSGGYKISALEIEDVMRKHPAIKDCAVVGVPDEQWGEVVVAAVISVDKSIDFELLANWLKEYLPAYKVPKRYLQTAALPRNVLGKVTKTAVQDDFIAEGE